MKLIRLKGGDFVFQIAPREKLLLLQVLRLYPLLPSTYFRLSKTADAAEIQADQLMLEEALAEQRKENRRHLDELLREPGRFVAGPNGLRFSLRATHVEWLLQVLNDIRVGSWLMLGSPDKAGRPIALNEQTALYFWSMEMSGFFQLALLEALDEQP